LAERSVVTVGQEIRRLREEKGWSQAKLGVVSGTGPSGISQIETGRRNPSAATLQRIAEALGVEVRDLFPLAQAPLEPPFNDVLAEEERRFAEQVREWRQAADEEAAARRHIEQELIRAGMSEEEARNIAWVHYRPPEYWQELARTEGLEVTEQRVDLEEENARLLEKIRDLEFENASLKERVAALRRELEEVSNG
jgi:transcriptional regulator with XRE-family HTH domain